MKNSFVKNSTLQVEAIIVHFTPECLGADFFRLPENKDLLKLFDKAQQGVRIKKAPDAGPCSGVYAAAGNSP